MGYAAAWSRTLGGSMSQRPVDPRSHAPASVSPYRGPAPTPPADGHGDALAHAREVVALAFGPVGTRPFDVRYWDGGVEHGGRGAPAFRLGINRPGALRRMLLP